jgi:SAM-dependent MidA family methyltransferase
MDFSQRLKWKSDSISMTTFKTALEKRLIERVERQGRMTFREFMQVALYDAQFGYYNTESLKIGAAGDYYTSSNVHPAFGAILAQTFVELWSQLEGKNSYSLVEMGAGSGQLAFDVLTALREEHATVFQQLSYTIVEQSPVMQARQRDKLKEFADQVCWHNLQELELEPITGLAFSNEFVDALPVHRVRFSPQGMEEQYIDVEKNPSENRSAIEPEKDSEEKKLALIWRELSDTKLADYSKRAGLRFIEGQVIEINLEAIDWLKKMSGVIESGFLLTIDYGDLAVHLYSPDRREGTLRCFYKHTLTNAPLERVGEQDITASVNFSALIDYGEDFGFEKVSYERQTNFLFRQGLIERIAAMENAGTIDNLKDRLAIKNLLAPGGVSDNFRVLVQRKA